VLESFSTWIQDVVRAAGYPGVFLMIFLESTLVPIPSELVMPFAGFMASQGEFSLPVILIINSTAALLGSGLCYGIGVLGGKPFLVNYGKYFLVRQHDIARTEAFLTRVKLPAPTSSGSDRTSNIPETGLIGTSLY